MPDVGLLLEKYGPRCAQCGRLATRITYPSEGMFLYSAWCEDFNLLIHSDSYYLASEVASYWVGALMEASLTESTDFAMDPVGFREGWYYCDDHQNDDATILYRELSHLGVRDVETVSIERPTRFERILESDA